MKRKVRFLLFQRTAARIAHCMWCWWGPRWMMTHFRTLPQWLLRNPHSYHDAPTIFLAVLSWLGQRGLGAGRGARCHGNAVSFCARPLAMSAAAGLCFHALSVLVLSRRIPAYALAEWEPRDSSWTVMTAAAEEYLWGRPGSGIIELLGCFAGFAALHYPHSGYRSAMHMLFFSLAARSEEQAYGWIGSVAFHAAYNLAVDTSILRKVG